MYELRPAHSVPSSRELVNAARASLIIHMDMIITSSPLMTQPFSVYSGSKKVQEVVG